MNRSFRRIRMSAFRRTPGYTLIELAVVIALIAILSGFAVSAFMGSGESRDAAMVQSAQTSLQQVISQASVRLDKTPQDVIDENGDDVENATRQMLMQTNGGDLGITLTQQGGGFVMRVEDTGRSASYEVSNSGDVTLDALGGSWTKYGVDQDNGVIQKL